MLRALLVAALVVALVAVALLVRSRFTRDPGESGAPTAIPRTGRPFPWRVEALLEQVQEKNPDFETTEFKVVLRDAKGKEVETPEVRLERDGVSLDDAVAGGSYYDRHPRYRLSEGSGVRCAPDTTHELVARRGDEAPQPIARIRTPKSIGLENLRVPAAHPRGHALEVGWAGLAQPAEILVYRTFAFTDEHGNHGFVEGGPHGDDAIRRRIGSRGLALPDGRTTIPASYFDAVEGKAVASVRLELTAEGETRFLCPVLESSVVRAVRRIALSVDVAEPSSR